MDKTIVMAIWIKQFGYGDMDKTIVMAIWIKQFYGDTSMDKTILWRYG